MAGQKIHSLMRNLKKNQLDMHLLQSLDDLLEALNPLKLNLDLWRAQNLCLLIGDGVLGGQGGPMDQQWLRLFRQLREYLNIHAP